MNTSALTAAQQIQAKLFTVLAQMVFHVKFVEKG